MSAHTLFILNDETVYGVGYNYYGQLSSSGTGNSYDPRLINISFPESIIIPQYNIRTGNFTLVDQDLTIDVNLL